MDITLCSGKHCILSDTCYRNINKHIDEVFNSHQYQYQSQFAIIPFDHDTNECDYYINMEKKYEK